MQEMGMVFSASHALQERAMRCLGGGPATLSKDSSRYPQGVSPLFLESASGCHVWDVDDQHYIDTVAALGPIILGHCDPYVTRCVTEQAALSTSLTLPHRLEVEIAELLQPLLPWQNNTRVRFGKDGMAATNAAVRVARHVTGGHHLIVSGYHGGADFYMASTDKKAGILPVIGEYTHQIPFGDIGAFNSLLRELDGDFAGMILEVPPRPWGEPLGVVTAYLAHVCTEVRKHGGLLILDEIVTGFRYPFAWKMYECVPDLICLGKGISNGYPLSALAGPAELMQGFDGGQVFWSTTFGGETVSLVAAKATIGKLFSSDGTPTGAWRSLEYAGAMFGERLNDLLCQYNVGATLLGNHARMILRWEEQAEATGAMLKTLWVAEHIKRGVLYGGPIFPMVCWDNTLVTVLIQVAAEVLPLMAHGLKSGTIADLLPCPPITDVFNTRYQETRR